MTGPNPSETPPCGLERLNRRRRRNGRNERRFTGKTYESWGEYSVKHLHTTGDTSSLNMWAYIGLFFASPVLLVVFIHIAVLNDGDRSGMPAADNAIWFVASVLTYLSPIIAFALLLIVASRLRIWWETDHDAKSRNDTRASD